MSTFICSNSFSIECTLRYKIQTRHKLQWLTIRAKEFLSEPTLRSAAPPKTMNVIDKRQKNLEYQKSVLYTHHALPAKVLQKPRNTNFTI